jgi:hypothetical protein
MIFGKILDGIDEVHAQIQNDFDIDLQQNLSVATVLMRGEHAVFPKTEAAMKRFLTAEDGKTMRPFNIVSAFVDFEEIYAEFHSEQHGLSIEEGTGFLQHYGFPTDVFDLSPCFNTARFFATYDKPEEQIGIIGAFERATLKGSFKITDLSHHPFALRPARQLAYSARPLGQIKNLKDPLCDARFKSVWYKFYKSPADLDFAKRNLAYVYPSEGEIDFFFGSDVQDFVTAHCTFEEMTNDQKKAVLEKVDSIRGQLSVNAEFFANVPPLCGADAESAIV